MEITIEQEKNFREEMLNAIKVEGATLEIKGDSRRDVEIFTHREDHERSYIFRFKIDINPEIDYIKILQECKDKLESNFGTEYRMIMHGSDEFVKHETLVSHNQDLRKAIVSFEYLPTPVESSNTFTSFLGIEKFDL